MKKIILKEDKENVLDELKSSLFVSYMQTSGDAVKRGWKLIQSIGNFLCLTRVTQLTIILYLKRKVNFKRFGSKLISIKSLRKKVLFLWYCNRGTVGFEITSYILDQIVLETLSQIIFCCIVLSKPTKINRKLRCTGVKDKPIFVL